MESDIELSMEIVERDIELSLEIVEAVLEGLQPARQGSVRAMLVMLHQTRTQREM